MKKVLLILFILFSAVNIFGEEDKIKITSDFTIVKKSQDDLIVKCTLDGIEEVSDILDQPYNKLGLYNIYKCTVLLDDDFEPEDVTYEHIMALHDLFCYHSNFELKGKIEYIIFSDYQSPKYFYEIRERINNAKDKYVCVDFSNSKYYESFDYNRQFILPDNCFAGHDNLYWVYMGSFLYDAIPEYFCSRCKNIQFAIMYRWNSSYLPVTAFDSVSDTARIYGEFGDSELIKNMYDPYLSYYRNWDYLGFEKDAKEPEYIEATKSYMYEGFDEGSYDYYDEYDYSDYDDYGNYDDDYYDGYDYYDDSYEDDDGEEDSYSKAVEQIIELGRESLDFSEIFKCEEDALFTITKENASSQLMKTMVISDLYYMTALSTICSYVADGKATEIEKSYLDNYESIFDLEDFILVTHYKGLSIEDEPNEFSLMFGIKSASSDFKDICYVTFKKNEEGVFEPSISSFMYYFTAYLYYEFNY